LDFLLVRGKAAASGGQEQQLLRDRALLPLLVEQRLHRQAVRAEVEAPTLAVLRDAGHAGRPEQWS